MRPYQVISGLYLISRYSLNLILGKERAKRVMMEHLGWVGIIGFTLWLRRILHIQGLVTMILVQEMYRSSGVYEGPTGVFLLKLKGDLFVDIGADKGQYCLLLRRNFRHILAFEPHPQNFQHLSRHVKFHGADNVVCIPAALCERDGFEELHIGRKSGYHSLLQSYTHFTDRGLRECITSNKSISIRAYSLNSILKGQIADLVKVDVEGAEWRVLEGTENVIGQIRSWIIELHDLRRKDELEKWFVKRSYRIRWLDAKHIYASLNPVQ